MSVLVIAEHDNAGIKSGTLNTITAAGKLGGDVHVLVAGSGCAAAAQAAAKIAGVAKVLVADAAQYAHGLAENLGDLVAGLAKGYSHVLAPATTYGKNFLPRVAALLDVAQISDIIKIESGRAEPGSGRACRWSSVTAETHDRSRSEYGDVL